MDIEPVLKSTFVVPTAEPDWQSALLAQLTSDVLVAEVFTPGIGRPPEPQLFNPILPFQE